MNEKRRSGPHPHLPPMVHGPPPYTDPPTYSPTGTIPRQRNYLETARSSTRSRSPSRDRLSQQQSPPSKRTHTISDSNSETDRSMDIGNNEDFSSTATKTYSFLLSNFDPKYNNPKQLLNQCLKYISRDKITRIIPTRNGTIIQTQDSNFATTIRNKYSFEIFGKAATMTRLDSKPLRQPPPPRKLPTLSVVIRGVDLDITDQEAEEELQLEGHTIVKCIRIKTSLGTPSYMVRVLTHHQQTINDLLSNGAYIYRRRYRVEPSRSQPPLPLRCERCQLYNAHHTINCPNESKCGYCTGPHQTRDCSNLRRPPKCNTCGEQHPTFSYKCKGRPTGESIKPEFIVPIRPTEQQPNSPPISPTQPITLEQLLTFFTITLQNLYPLQRPHVLSQIQYAARTTFNLNFHATYSGPYVHFHLSSLETAV